MLRDYQQVGYDSVTSGWAKDQDRQLVVWPTGTGKTVLFVELAGDESGRSLIICPTIELIDQTARKVHEITGISPAIEQAGRRSDERQPFRSRIVVASKQTLWPKRYMRIRDISTVIVDEAHLSCTDPYRVMIEYFIREFGAKILGVTATPRRLDKRALGAIYGQLAHSYPLKRAISDGWLVAPKVHSVVLKDLDLSLVKNHRGDFSQASLGKVLEEERFCVEVAEVTATEFTPGEPTVVFCASVEQARRVAHRLCDVHGLKFDWICADTKRCPREDRTEALRRFHAGESDGICNVGILTVGWDFPKLKHIVMARPTKSLTLLTQILGRGTRPLAGVVDFPGSAPLARREAISASDKPYFRFTDLRDNTVRMKLAHPIDCLKGDMDWPGRDFAIARMEQGAEVSDALFAEAEGDEMAAHFHERRKMAAIRARYNKITVEVDPFGGPVLKIEPRDPQNQILKFGRRYNGQRFKDIPDWYLEWIVREGAFAEWAQNAARTELATRASAQPHFSGV